MTAAIAIDRDYLTGALVRLAQSPTDVPVGQTELAPDDPKITAYVRGVLAPALAEVGLPLAMIDDWNNGVGYLGPASAGQPALLLMLYTTSQHGTFTDETLEGRLADGSAFGVRDLCVFGRGTNQGKGPAAAVLAALKALRDAGVRLRRRLVVAVNAEGRSSHGCSARLIDEHGVRADQGIVCIGTGNEIVLGNRGRVDIRVTVRGRSAHSSHPHLAVNPILGVGDVLNRLARLAFPKRHPTLGPEQLTVYKLVCAPIAPHTIPDRCELTLDRRLLPGSTIEEAVAEIRTALDGSGPWTVEVEPGASMLPAEVPADAPVVRALDRATREVTGRPAVTAYAGYTFDAGYACARGIPTVMFGPALPGRTRGLASDVTTTEFVPLSVVREGAEIYLRTIMTLCAEA
jgi:acetylornithine deacetylase/succinyl-diaminopimelate desuccinylase-like protein